MAGGVMCWGSWWVASGGGFAVLVGAVDWTAAN